MEQDTAVKVAVRLRPLSDSEITQQCAPCIGVVPNAAQIVVGTEQFFTFDHVFGPDTHQIEIYEECVKDLVDATFEGFNATILAYGQTGSGKTHTMGSSSSMRLSEEQIGIIPRVIQQVFNMVKQREADNPNCTYRVSMQFLEIYGEDIRDLLDPLANTKVLIREHPTGEVYVSGAREELVTSAEEMTMALEKGTMNRTTGSTLMNQTSSRSHAIFTILLEKTMHSSVPDDEGSEVVSHMENEDGVTNTPMSIPITALGAEVQRCKFHFVDLAGSERAKRTGAEGQRMREGIDINKGLLVLGNVISALGDEKKRGKTHVPYRDSKLTRMLQDSLGGNSKTLMICCASPADSNLQESVNALKYANRARNIKNKPVVNRDPTALILHELKNQVQMVASELLSVRLSGCSSDGPWGLPRELLEQLASSNSGAPVPLLSTSIGRPPSTAGSSPRGQPSTVAAGSSTVSAISKQEKAELLTLRARMSDYDCEVLRLTEQLKRARSQLGIQADQSFADRSERDFFRMKWADADPEAAKTLEQAERSQLAASGGAGSALVEEKRSFTSSVASYMKEIDSLKAELETMKREGLASGGRGGQAGSFNKSNMKRGELASLEVEDAEEEIDSMQVLLEGELTNSVARVIARAQEQVREEQRRLKSLAEGIDKDKEGGTDGSDDEDIDGNASGENGADQVEQVQMLFQRRQQLMSVEVNGLSESIMMKEQLLHQLQSSQKQYEAMKAYYESKLEALTDEMRDKEEEVLKLVTALEENKSDKLLQAKLLQAEEEVRAIKKKHFEVAHMAKVGSRHSDQTAKLMQDIENMKRQKTALSRGMTAEKKAHMQALTQKAKEIEKLKRELSKSTAELLRVGKDKEVAEQKVRDALKEGSNMRKKAANDLRAPEPGTQARAARKAMKTAPKLASGRLLSDEQLKTKKWIQQKVAEVAAREEAVDKLHRLLSEQLNQSHERDMLIEQRNSLLRNSNNSADLEADSVLSEVESKLRAMEDTRLLEMETQLEVRASHIGDLQRQLGQNTAGVEVKPTGPNPEKILETLQTISSSSSTAAQDMIRAMFDLNVMYCRRSEQRKEQIDQAEHKVRSLETEIGNLRSSIAEQRLLYDKDSIKQAQEYDEKISGLLDNSNMESLLKANTPSTSRSGGSEEDSSSRTDGSGGSIEQFKMMLTLSTERNSALKQQLSREFQKSQGLQERLLDMSDHAEELKQKLSDTNSTIRFLEEECRMLREISDEFKAKLKATGGELGKAIILQVRSVEVQRRGGLEVDDDDDDTESVAGEFSSLVDEIHRTGGIAAVVETKSRPISLKASGTSSTGGGASSIFDRLTDPSYFTGTQKNLFQQDLEVKRAKVLQIKEAEATRRRKDQLNPTSSMNGGSGGGESFMSRSQSPNFFDDVSEQQQLSQGAKNSGSSSSNSSTMGDNASRRRLPVVKSSHGRLQSASSTTSSTSTDIQNYRPDFSFNASKAFLSSTEADALSVDDTDSQIENNPG